jgi:UDP-glucuronate decarboxylase
MKKSILITGGCGNVGGSLARRLSKDKNNSIAIVDNLVTGCKSKLPNKNLDNWDFFEEDCNDFQAMSKIMNSYNFDYVFHYAALVGVKRTLESPISVLEDIEGIENMLKLSHENKVKRFFYSSSSEVYGEPVEFPQKEDTTPLNSRLPYAIVKNVGEAFVKSYFKEFGLNFSIFRFFNTYGPLQSSDFVMSKFLDQAINGKDITIYGDGTQTRTFCYIEDNLDVVESILNNNMVPNEVLNIGNNIEISMLDLAKKIINITQSNSKIIHLPSLEEGDMTRRQPDISKMKKILGRDLVSIDDGIKLLIEAKNS